MKRFLTLVLAMLLAFSFSACGEKVDPEIQKKNEETLAAINKDNVGQYLGDGTYQFNDITFKVNQNFTVKASEAKVGDSHNFTYFVNDDSGFLFVTYYDNPLSKSDFKSGSTEDKEINGIRCFQRNYSSTENGKERTYSETYIPCGEGTLFLCYSNYSGAPFQKYQVEYNNTLSSIKQIP